MALNQSQIQSRISKVSGIRNRIKCLSAEDRTLILGRGYVRSCDGRQLSESNILMLADQGNTDAVVGGYRQWQKSGRQVRGGAHGFLIAVPRTNKREGSDSKPVFLYTYVFGHSQTDPISNERN